VIVVVARRPTLAPIAIAFWPVSSLKLMSLKASGDNGLQADSRVVCATQLGISGRGVSHAQV